MFTDTHCHLFKEYYDNINDVIIEAKNNNIYRMINNGVDASSNKEVIEISKKYTNVFSAIGIHPEAANNYEEKDIKFIEENIDNIIAIGEIGLDYHYEKLDKDKQKELLEKQLLLAQKYNKPVIIHNRESTEDLINILKKYPSIKGVIHCFSGSLETAKILIKMGYKLGFNGVITFKNAKIKEVVKQIPVSSIVLETDSPYLTPEPYRGHKNEPKNIIHIAKFISKETNVSLIELAKITEKNIKEIFDI